MRHGAGVGVGLGDHAGQGASLGFGPLWVMGER